MLGVYQIPCEIQIIHILLQLYAGGQFQQCSNLSPSLSTATEFQTVLSIHGEVQKKAVQP